MTKILQRHVHSSPLESKCNRELNRCTNLHNGFRSLGSDIRPLVPGNLSVELGFEAKKENLATLVLKGRKHSRTSRGWRS